eukprot:4852209-Pyramimonas_sp.AAC.1
MRHNELRTDRAGLRSMKWHSVAQQNLHSARRAAPSIQQGRHRAVEAPAALALRDCPTSREVEPHTAAQEVLRGVADLV